MKHTYTSPLVLKLYLWYISLYFGSYSSFSILHTVLLQGLCICWYSTYNAFPLSPYILCSWHSDITLSCSLSCPFHLKVYFFPQHLLSLPLTLFLPIKVMSCNMSYIFHIYLLVVSPVWNISSRRTKFLLLSFTIPSPMPKYSRSLAHAC